MNEVNARIGRKRGPMTRYYDRIKRQTANKLVAETGGWKRDLGQSYLDIIEIEDCTQVYGEQHAD
jgi:hypothetical protein